MMMKVKSILTILSRGYKVETAIEEAKRQGKPWYKSKTVWVNIVALVASVAAVYGLEIKQEEQYAIAVGILAVVNIILRFVTREPVYIRKGGSQNAASRTEQIDKQTITSKQKTNTEDKPTVVKQVQDEHKQKYFVVYADTDDLDDFDV